MSDTVTLSKREIARLVARELVEDGETREMILSEARHLEGLWTAKRCCQFLDCSMTSFREKIMPRLERLETSIGLRFRAEEVRRFAK